MVSQWWPAQLGSGLITRIADTLADVGAVTVVTGTVPARPQQQSAWWRRSYERMGPYPVFRFASYPGRTASAVKRIGMYTSFAASSSLGSRKVLKTADVAVIYSSPATAAAAPMLNERLHGVPYILIIQDVWPDSGRSWRLPTGMLRTSS
jgi:hypothetical protein